MAKRNNIIHLSKRFTCYNHPPAKISYHLNADLYLNHIESLKSDLERLKGFWDTEDLIGEYCIVSAFCSMIVAKSNRIRRLFHFDKDANDYLVGVRFNDNVKKYAHIITYSFKKKHLQESINMISEVIKVFNDYNLMVVKKTEFDDFQKIINKKKFNYSISYSAFLELVQELSYIHKFDTYQTDVDMNVPTTVTFFDLKCSLSETFKKLGLNIPLNRINENTALLFPDEFKVVKSTAGYLISMALNDFTKRFEEDKINPSDLDYKKVKDMLPSPKNEPIIGVIDSPFSKEVYFSDWVEYHHLINENIKVEPEDYGHGTAVSSLIVDLPSLNPKLDDHCGRFRVRHFGVTLPNGGTSTFNLMKQIENIVRTNRDIHVWNLSLGSNEEISMNFISPEAYTLDKLQNEFKDLVFVVSGTNLPEGEKEMYIGSPADSINSIVVNSVRIHDNQKASYSRHGPVLSFFVKPDISYYGGDKDEEIVVSYPFSLYKTSGTSLAAPLIARKMAYMIDVLGFSRDSAKALLIDSVFNFQDNEFEIDKRYYGYGIPPILIDDIVSTPKDEIKVFIEGSTNMYSLKEYNFPVPLDRKGKYPYYLRAVLCYYPDCSRKQGVDYTENELSFNIGRITTNKRHDQETIMPLVNDVNDIYVKEDEARLLFRKWDNIKVIQEKEKKIKVTKKIYSRDNWGFDLTYINRNKTSKEPLNFGMVITLKAMDGENRYEEFIKKCKLNNWIVNEIKVEEKATLYEKASVDVEWD